MTQPDDRLLIPRADAKRILGGIGDTTLWELQTAGEVECVHIGRRSFITATSLHAYVERLRDQASA
ncbi:helix-turn-helix domain-containing protein [Mycobacterium sp.]|uniref:helix-turn-helix domain-containing protein n=1 Tax=Mycobacterium sp. TaxID=1785 RepID=UPI003F9C5047